MRLGLDLAWLNPVTLIQLSIFNSGSTVNIIPKISELLGRHATAYMEYMPNSWLIATNVSDLNQWYGYFSEAFDKNTSLFIVPVAPQSLASTVKFLPENVREFVTKNFSNVIQISAA